METETVFHFVFRLLKARILSVICLVKGHDWQYIGEWDDEMTWQCRRCYKIKQARP